MLWASRSAVVRIGTGLGVVVLAGWVAGRFMCRCPGGSAGQSVMSEISVANLRRHVETLAGEIGERNVFRPAALQRAADYIEQVWREQGYRVDRQEYTVQGERSANVEVTLGGSQMPAEIVLVGAHYDSVPGSPGANDNATGVAAMLEISRVLAAAAATAPPARTVRFVAFVNEEPPFFKTRQMGSRLYARAARQRGDRIVAMLSLETIGYFSDAPGSQHYPPLFGFFYPDRGNFIAFVSNLRSRSLLHRAVAAFRAASDFPVECVATFAAVPGVDWSDHGSFWLEGYRAVMVTDTAPYRYPFYHTGADTPEKVNYEALGRVSEGILGVVRALAGQ